MPAVGPHARIREIDDAAARLVARLRVLVLTLVLIVAAVAFGEGGHRGFQYSLAFVVLPAAVAIALAVDSMPPTVAAALGGAVDVGVAAVSFAAFPDALGTVGAAFLIPVMVACYTGGRWLGVGVGGAALASLLVEDALGEVALSAEVALLMAAGIAGSVALVGRTDARLLRSARRATYHEARAAALFDSLAEPIVVTDGTARITQLNGAAARFLGHGANAGTCGSAMPLLIDGARVDCRAGCALLRHAGSRDHGGVEAIFCPTDRAAVPVLVSIAEIENAENGSREYIHTLRDVSALKRADEAKTLFLATTTHELKTPLTVIRGFLDILGRPDVDDATRTAAIDVMRDRAMELSAIVERVLLASRIEAGKLTVAVHSVDVTDITRERVRALATASGRLIALRTDTAPPARADEQAVITVLDHLLDNACKYSPPAAPIDVSISADDERVHISVRDGGHGMSPDQVERCFDRFWQADSSSRRRVGGTGIGLYIVRSLVESMGGSVKVESAIDKGTTFTFSMPRADVAHEPAADTATLEPEPSIVREFMRQIGVRAKERT